MGLGVTNGTVAWSPWCTASWQCASPPTSAMWMDPGLFLIQVSTSTSNLDVMRHYKLKERKVRKKKEEKEKKDMTNLKKEKRKEK